MDENTVTIDIDDAKEWAGRVIEKITANALDDGTGELPTLAAVPEVNMTVGFADLVIMCKAMLPHVDKNSTEAAVLWQFTGEHLVMFAGGPYGAAAGKVAVRQYSGLTGAPADDTLILSAATVQKISTLFKPRRSGGALAQDDELDITVEPLHASIRANSELLARAAEEKAAVTPQNLRPTARLHVADISVLFGGDEFIANNVPAHADAADYPYRVRTFVQEPADWPSAREVDVAGPALANLAASSKALDHRIVLTGPAVSSRLVATLGDDFVAVVNANEIPEGEARLERKRRGVWTGLLEDLR